MQKEQDELQVTTTVEGKTQGGKNKNIREILSEEEYRKLTSKIHGLSR